MRPAVWQRRQRLQEIGAVADRLGERDWNPCWPRRKSKEKDAKCPYWLL